MSGSCHDCVKVVSKMCKDASLLCQSAWCSVWRGAVLGAVHTAAHSTVHSAAYSAAHSADQVNSAVHSSVQSSVHSAVLSMPSCSKVLHCSGVHESLKFFLSLFTSYFCLV